MRVTNSMMTNRMLLNMNRNMQNLDMLNNRLATTKKIQVPSDNPILAARALKFRTSLGETEQYKRNVGQGISWMSATDKALMNVTSMKTSIRTLCNQAASGENTYEERNSIITEIKQLMDQLGTEMKATYAGRYIFSGYRTDQPPVFETNQDLTLKYDITEKFDAKDIEVTKSFQKLDPVSEPIVNHDVKIMKLPYTGVTNLSVKTYRNDISMPPLPVLVGDYSPVIVTKTLSEADAYLPTNDSINYIGETGELVLGKNVFNDFQFKAPGFNVKVEYTKQGFKAGELNPKVYFTSIDGDGKVYNMDTQNLQYEFSVNTRININTLAKDIMTDKLYTDLRELYQFVSSVSVSDETKLREDIKVNPANYGITTVNDETVNKALNDQLSREKQQIEATLHDRFNNMLGLVDRHFDRISKQEADLGSRMKRLQLIEDRLAEEKVNYSELLSGNEDADLVETSIELSSAQAVYNSSLKAGASIIQSTLADYIR